MKKVIMSLLVMGSLMFSLNVKAEPFISVPAGAVMVMAMVANAEYKSCNDKPYVTAKAANGNYFYNASQCEVDAKK